MQDYGIYLIKNYEFFIKNHLKVVPIISILIPIYSLRELSIIRI